MTSDGATIERRSIRLEAALKVARAGLAAGQARGAEMAVAVVDGAGILLVLLRADRATEQFVEGAIQKAWTAVNLRASTRELFESIRQGDEDNSQLPQVPKALFLMGGLPLRMGDEIVGGVGAAGSPSGLVDEEAAQAAAQAFADLLAAPPAAGP